MVTNNLWYDWILIKFRGIKTACVALLILMNCISVLKSRISIAAVAAGLTFASSASAGSIAIFGDNGIDNYLATLGHSVTLVSDSQLATSGFLSSFDAFFMTRAGSSFGTGLSLAASANVSSFVGSSGNVVLLNGDFADGVGSDASIQALIANSVTYALASGRGFIGEFNGSVAALTSNSNGFNPLGLISGSAGSLGSGAGGSSLALYKTAAGASHSITSGLANGYNPPSVEFGASMSGLSGVSVLATFGEGGNAAVIIREGQPAAVPEGGSVLALVGLGFGLMALARRRR